MTVLPSEAEAPAAERAVGKHSSNTIANVAAYVRAVGVPEQRISTPITDESNIVSRRVSLAKGNMPAIFVHGMQTCIDVEAEGFGDGLAIDVDEAVFEVCKDGPHLCSMRKNLTMVHNGKVDMDFARSDSARGSLVGTLRGAQICFKPSAARQGRIFVNWHARSSPIIADGEVARSLWQEKKKQQQQIVSELGSTVQVGNEEEKAEKEIAREPGWCAHDQHGCWGDFELGTHVICPAGRVYFQHFQDCGWDGDSSWDIFWWFIGFVIFLIVVIVIIWLCVYDCYK
jgi:hypothetical protein